MNCDDILREILDPERQAAEPMRAELEAHLQACANCRDVCDRLAAIEAPTAVLPREIAPSRDLWPGIASRLDAAKPKKRILRFTRFIPLAAAAGMAGILATSLLSLPPDPTKIAAETTTLKTRPTETKPANRLPSAAVEVGFERTRAVLMKRFEAQKSTTPADQTASFELSLSTMTSAVEDIHSALERDPYNASLLMKLSQARRRELRLLQQVIL
jgi:hypothetical protein